MKKITNRVDYQTDTKELALFAKALAHPARIKILKYLLHQSCCYTGDLIDELPLAQSTISQHLKELKNAGLIQGEITPPRTKYCIDEANWKKANELFRFFLDQNIEGGGSCKI